MPLEMLAAKIRRALYLSNENHCGLSKLALLDAPKHRVLGPTGEKKRLLKEMKI